MPDPCGTITFIQRMSLHDGPGIRSTVFLKGCNMRCGWCHNPETWSSKPQLQLFAAKCIGCGSCTAACRYGAIGCPGGGVAVERTKCRACGRCAGECPSGALRMVGRRVTASEVVRQVAEDETFYRESGGGVTLSGGEPLVQPAFVRAILERCKQSGLHTAIESNLGVPQRIVEQMIPLTDLWLCDLKLADPALHRLHTGRSNRTTLRNLRLLSARGASVTVRTPVVPGVNDSPGQIGAICGRLAQLPSPPRYELLAFHPLGFDKFVTLGMRNPMPEALPVAQSRMQELARLAREKGLML